MTILYAGGQACDVDVVVFDKDGLLFDSRHFWKMLAYARLQVLTEVIGSEGAAEWCRLFGVRTAHEELDGADPDGIFALASPEEEIVVTASVIRSFTGLDWGECRSRAQAVFKQSDAGFDLAGALRPKSGFPFIFDRLERAGLAYGIATSDDLSRTLVSLEQFGQSGRTRFIVTPKDVKRGKPNPDMLERVAELTGTMPARIAMVGDSFVDVQMARAAGCIGIGIPDDPAMKLKMLPFADIILDSLEEIRVPGDEDAAPSVYIAAGEGG
ncbi:HAD-IA family hydrolase [Paenibacillus sp. S150]|uniref:HAD-IA family hydrolase n=1 Tax=Paenibacillus sp. S150 TaxID=2749826 RepID=UPI001C59173F|nr:HAD-IA family hydrolase [Paenibacillus sp. S150]MBW4081184.1 HAD-IA family hydrolase [Paenibacillus sp. S150]